MIAHGDKIKGSNDVVTGLTKGGVKLDSLGKYFDFLIARGDEIKGSNEVVIGLTKGSVKLD